MTTNQLREFLVSQAPWVDPNNTVDTIKIGDPNKPIQKIGVGWMATIYDLQAAHNAGCELFITHEPTFNDHLDPLNGECRRIEPGNSKRLFLEETGMVVLRVHDVWDAWPNIGIRDSWARGLGLTKFIAENKTGSQARWHALYEIEETTLKDFAAHVARRVKPLGQDGVQVMGDPNRKIRRPALGVGCGGPDKDMVDLGADVLIVCYDGAAYWSTRERLFELGAAIIAVEHGTSEMWGLENFAAYLRQSFADLEVLYFDRHPRTWHQPAED